VPEPQSRLDLIADAAIATLAAAGMRGLTHRAVDRAAGLPEGSTSYYLRTRQALLQAATERLAARDAAELAERPALRGDLGPERIAAAIAAIVAHWTGPGRERMLARYELALEANRRPELRRVFVAAGARFRTDAEAMLAAAGAADPPAQAPLLVAYLDGLIFDHLAGAGSLELGEDRLREGIEDLLRSFTRG
jgi:DNA-binding transcriptional regulator YbjK